jgi:hypothetical protein
MQFTFTCLPRKKFNSPATTHNLCRQDLNYIHVFPWYHRWPRMGFLGDTGAYRPRASQLHMMPWKQQCKIQHSHWSLLATGTWYLQDGARSRPSGESHLQKDVTYPDLSHLPYAMVLEDTIPWLLGKSFEINQVNSKWVSSYDLQAPSPPAHVIEVPEKLLLFIP